MSEQNQDGLFSCRNICWMIAVILGFAAFMVSLSKFGFSPLLSMLVGIVVFFLGGWQLGKYLCTAPEQSDERVEEAPVSESAPTPVTNTEPEVSQAPVAKTDVATTAVKSSILPGEAELAERKGSWKYEADTPKPKNATEKSVVKTDDTAAVAEKKPRAMKTPRKSGADDLKKLKGVGPKLEQTLNELGFYHFDQIAKWGSAEIAWVDARLKFKGRIERDGWIDQAKILADGGETEFSKRGKNA